MDIKDLLEPRYEVHIVHNGKESYTKASGNLPSLLTALSTLTNALKESGATNEMIDYAVKQGLMTDEELTKETENSIDKLLKKIFD